MALRRTAQAFEDTPTDNPVVPYVELVGKNAFRSIDGHPFSIWQYRLRGSAGSQPRPTYYEYSSDDPRSVLTARIGLAFPSQLDIKTPELYPECQVVQGTTILQPAGNAAQYVFRRVDAGGSADYLDLF